MPAQWRAEGRTEAARIAGASFAIAKFFALLFLILFLVFLVLGLTAAKRIAA